MLTDIFILLMSLTLSLAWPDEPIVKTESGFIRGFVSNSTNGRPFYSFRAIPYAQAPVGEFRFKPPRKFGNWTGVRDGSQLGPVCPQIRITTFSPDGDEDCLVLNVYSPKTVGWRFRRSPVLVWIHGGGYTFSSGRYDDFGPQNYMDSDVVLVSINYRLGILGFLATNDSSAYGNYAMLDQVMALQWVQDNIRCFGGDPDRVTIFGQSAGGVSVSFHLLSRLSTGLFSKAICQSGVSSMFFNPDPLPFAKSFASIFGCNVDDTSAMVDCLRNQSAQAIVLSTNPFLPIELTPVVEPPDGPGFLTEAPLTLLESGRIPNKVPVIIGKTALEGYLIFNLLAPTFKYLGSAYFANQFASQLPLYSKVQPNMTDAVQAIKDHYISNNTDLDNLAVFTTVLSNISGDALIDVEIARNAYLLSKAGFSVFAYIYNYVGQNCFVGLVGGACGIYSSHADEVFLQFQIQSTPPLNANDAAVSKIINSLWVDFASDKQLSISHNQKWPKYSKNNPRYVQLNLSPAIKDGPLSNETEFWLVTIPNIIEQYP